jgi:PAS domain S-box-containing protein
MPESREPVEIPARETGRHQHLCLLHQGEAHVLTPLLPFIQQGIAQGERCLYLNAGADTLELAMKHALSDLKHDRGALRLLPVQETWLKGGSFAPARMLELLQTLCEDAARDGFKGTRIVCDMGWAGLQAAPIELLCEFEQALNGFAMENEVTLLCLYNRELFPAERMLELAKSHTHLAIGGQICCNPLYLPPGLDPRISRAACELDLFLAAVQTATDSAANHEKMRLELEQAYSALARKIYENWQEEDTLRASEKELHEKDEALIAHKRRLQTILQHIPSMLMSFDAAGRLAACNHEFERVTGYRAEEVMGKPMLELIRVEEALHAAVLAAHPAQGGDYRGREWGVKCKDGSLKTISWSNISRYVQIPGWTNWIIGLDVTPRVHAEAMLKSLSDELDARIGELEFFGHEISRDVSSHLAKVLGHCTVIQDLYGATLSPQCREMLRDMHEAILDMAERIAELQRFTALAAGGLQPEEVDLSAMVSEIAAQLRGTEGKRPVTFQIEDGVTATGDKKLLRLAMEQLLENAWNYTLSVQHPVIQFGTAQVEGERSFYVSDNGPRFSGLAQVSEPVVLPESAGHFCCGIGLATVQRIINLHRGRIWAEDEAGRGGTLFFRV